MVSHAETKFIPQWYGECNMHFILYNRILVSIYYLHIIKHICIYLIHIIYPNMLLMNLMLSPLFPLPSPTLLKLLYYTAVNNIFVKMVFCGCRSKYVVSGLITEISTMVEVVNTFLDNETLTNQNSLTHLLDSDEENEDPILSIQPSLYCTMADFINKMDSDS